MPQELTVLIHIYCVIREQPEVENLRIQPYWETILSFSQRSLLHFYSIGLGSFSPCVSAEQLQHGKFMSNTFFFNRELCREVLEVTMLLKMSFGLELLGETCGQDKNAIWSF